jgi:hypothetical protein
MYYPSYQEWIREIRLVDYPSNQSLTRCSFLPIPSMGEISDNILHCFDNFPRREVFFIFIFPMSYYFTSESVTAGHPDKICDQISDAILDAYLALDPFARVACECLVTTGTVVLAGEITSHAKVDHTAIARETIIKIGYDREELLFDGHTCRIEDLIHSQSPDIAMGVDTG